MLIFVYITQRSDSPSPRPTGESPVWVTFSLFPPQGRKGKGISDWQTGEEASFSPFLQAVMSQFPQTLLLPCTSIPDLRGSLSPVLCNWAGGLASRMQKKSCLLLLWPASSIIALIHHKGTILAFLKRYVLQFNVYFSVFRSQQEKRDVAYCIFSKIDLRDTLSHVPIIQSPQHRAKTRFEHKHPGSNLDSMNAVPFILSHTSPPPPSHFLCTVFCQSNESFLIFRSSSFGSLCVEKYNTLWLHGYIPYRCLATHLIAKGLFNILTLKDL